MRAAAIVLVALLAVLVAALVVGRSGPSAVSSPSPIAAASPSSSSTPVPSPTATPTNSPSPIPLPTLVGLSAPSGRVVWAFVAARLFVSTDRGDTWTERPTPTPFTNPEIAFTSDAQGWASFGGTPATQCTQQAVTLSHTTDAGATWQAITPTGIAPAQCKEALSFPDAQHGFLSAWDPNSRPVIYRSTDGGRTWSASRPLPDPAGFTTTGAGIALRAGPVKAFGQALLVEASGRTASGQRRYVYISGDGGATWMHVANAPDPDNAVVFVTGSRWLQISTPANSRETTDSGATWHAFTTDYAQAAPIAPVILFGDEQIGYATVRGGIQRTTDGGLHWTGLKTPGT
jgi:photosystem II stability/assembly factor-like uncharacterized protein